MGGIAVKNNHETNVKNLYAIGECATIYHGANRLGGNSLLAAIYGGRTAAASIEKSEAADVETDWSSEIEEAAEKLRSLKVSQSLYPVKYIRDMLAETMRKDLGIVRNFEKLQSGIDDISFYLSVADKIRYDSSELAYFGYSMPAILTLAKATLICAQSRKESRGAHYRSDHPVSEDAYQAATIIRYDNGVYHTYLDTEGKYES
ncbi:MAG: FAD-binding protein, partial [Clostridia bacterium]|nr:FAD-binding protein [Clostridia bacterium]